MGKRSSRSRWGVPFAWVLASACAPVGSGGGSDEGDGGRGGMAVDGATTPTCDDGRLSGLETDVDCGGDCAPCVAERGCRAAEDCESGVCTEEACAPPSCVDGVTNGLEVGPDCGAVCDAPCPDASPCNDGAGCVSGVCVDDLCVAPACDDAIENGSESDVDCGGVCDPCADDRGCSEDEDCVSGHCRESVCLSGLRATYPEGPYTTSVGGTVENIELVLDDGEPVTFGDLRRDPDDKVMLIFSTGAWCGRCAADMPDLRTLHARLGEQGLLLVVSLLEDSAHGPASAHTAAQYKSRHELLFPTVADPDGDLHRYFPEIALPMVMVVELDGMQLLYAATGWDLAAMEAFVRQHL